MITNHWGITVNSEVPITGVVNASRPEWLYMENGINLEFEDHIKKCSNEYHDFCCEDSVNDTILIGYIKDNTGKYVFDKKAEYSAIISEVYAQITQSRYVSRCALCSPCYPGQGDLDTKGDYMTFTLPPDIWGEAEHLEIFEIHPVLIENLQ